MQCDVCHDGIDAAEHEDDVRRTVRDVMGRW